MESFVGLAQHYKGWSLTINPRKQQNNLHKKRVRTWRSNRRANKRTTTSIWSTWLVSEAWLPHPRALPPTEITRARYPLQHSAAPPCSSSLQHLCSNQSRTGLKIRRVVYQQHGYPITTSSRPQKLPVLNIPTPHLLVHLLYISPSLRLLGAAHDALFIRFEEGGIVYRKNAYHSQPMREPCL